jgi:hypothetical protein
MQGIMERKNVLAGSRNERGKNLEEKAEGLKKVTAQQNVISAHQY